MTRTKEIILLLLIVLLTISLVIVSSSTKGILIFKNLSEVINKQIIYQSITLLGTFFFLFVLWMTKKKELKTYFQKGNISAEIIPEPIVGIKSKPNENWFHIGINFSIIVSVVTAIVIYFQIISENGISLRDILKVLPFSVVFALSNAFVEESITV
jgi:cell division protein FtsW (lipid II flippase)